jgi:hypothetical protein
VEHVDDQVRQLPSTVSGVLMAASCDTHLGLTVAASPCWTDAVNSERLAELLAERFDAIVPEGFHVEADGTMLRHLNDST